MSARRTEGNRPHASPRILVVEHEANAGAGIVGRALEAAGATLDVVGPENGAPIPGALDGFDGFIVLGGTPGPLEDERAPWLSGTRALIADALRDGIPYLGVCLGAQMLAVVAGGAVEDAVHPEIGLTDLELTEAAEGDALLGGLGVGLRAMQWHFLEVSALPPGSVSLCRSDGCPNQAFRVGDRAWGVQFHLEADAETARAWADPGEAKPELDRLGLTRAEVVNAMAAHEGELRVRWGAVAERWLAVVRG